MIKTLELFGGIGSPRKALENLGLEVDKIKYVEWWTWPVKAYNKLFNNDEMPRDVLNTLFDIDILVHGSPCQDFSVAGKNDLASGRSILYKRTLDIIDKLENGETKRPKVVIWENVKGLLSKKNFPHFQHYLDTMESFGYKNNYKILNSKDFGIPQSRNRVFVVSILKGQQLFNNNFNFDNLEMTPYKPLKEFLEPHNEVDKSYYITQKSMTKAIEQGKIKIVDEYVETILTKQFRWNSNGVAKVPLHEKPFNSTDFIHNPETSEMHTIGSNSANNRIAVPLRPIEKMRVGKHKIDINGFDQESRVYDENSYIDTLTQNPKSSKVKVPIIEMKTKNYTNFTTIPRASDAKLINGAHNRVWKEDKYIGTIAASANTKIQISAIDPIPGVPIFIIDGKPYHLRVLTQREIWRLMGWDNESINKVIDMPKTHMYHMAGNAIVIQVLEAIFKELIRGSKYE